MGVVFVHNNIVVDVFTRITIGCSQRACTWMVLLCECASDMYVLGDIMCEDEVRLVMGCVQWWGVFSSGVCSVVGCVQWWGVFSDGVCLVMGCV